MEEKFAAAWEQNRTKAAALGVRMRPLDVKGAKRVLSGTRLSDGFNELAAKGGLKLWQEVRLLAKLRREQAPKRLFDLAQKAKFSQHTLSGEELAEMEQYIMENTAQLQTGPWYEQLVWRYLFAV